MYSQKTIDLLDEYIKRFPELIEVLLKTDSVKDTFKSEDMFPDSSTRYGLMLIFYHKTLDLL